MEQFNYNESVRQVEEILRKVEDPDTPFEQSRELVGQARKLLDSCYGFLRSLKDGETLTDREEKL